MKLIYFFLIGILLFSCAKSKNDLGPEFDNLIGKWENQIGDDHVQLEFFKNGKIELQSSIQRRKIYKTLNYETRQNSFDSNWQNMSINFKGGKNNRLYFSYNSEVDSIKIFTGDNIENFTYVDNSSYGNNYLLRIK